MSEGLYTVIICTSKPVTRKTGTVNQDVIETYYDATWPQVLAYRKKYDGEITVEPQSRRLDKLPKVETGESPIALKRFPSQPRLNVEISPISKSEPPIKSHGGLGVGGYAELVNVMMNEGA